MKKLRLIGLLLWGFTAIGCQQMGMDPGDPPSGTPNSKSYQQDVASYSGTRSVGISTYGGLGNIGQYNANGTTFADGLNDWCTGTDITGMPYSEVWLLRFDNLDIPSTARVTRATLTVHAYGNDTNSQLFLSGTYLIAPWNADVPGGCAGCSNAPVGWRYRDGAANSWSALGAAGAEDIGPNSFRLPDAGFFALGSTPNPYSTSLDASVVQSWVAGQNYGVRIIAGVDRVHMGYVQPQRDITPSRPVTLRPQLVIDYLE